ncbi:Hypothetical predicted protein [Pelobates cultripes]|uniref:Uncharacterized protein n=1 Tax=Pelobates cultripes TaxID=61616 RepID=A0AAD1STQ9_PELCU|nr:Hypothetical predicted protein [Pelobates cultripes]
MTSCTILQHGGFILVKLNTYDQNKLPEKYSVNWSAG